MCGLSNLEGLLLTMVGRIQPYSNLWRRSYRREGRECTPFSICWCYCGGGSGKEYLGPERHGQNITVSVGALDLQMCNSQV